MKNQPGCPPRPMFATVIDPRRFYKLALLLCLSTLLSACSANRTDSTKGQRLRLNVGDIRELTLSARSDTTWQLTATSDNQEVVDVARKPPMTTTGNGTSPATGSAVFLIKGVTAGTARVVFSEKPTGTDGSGRVKKTYVVTVTTE